MRLAYSALLLLLLPLILLRMLWRSRRAPAYRQRLAERLGVFSRPDDPRPVIWLHAVSLGETLAAKGLVERLLDDLPQYQLVITTTTPTGSEQVRRLFGERVFHVYAPWDTPGSVRRFLARTEPQLLVLMETELWPNMLHYCARAGCRVMLANARLSARSAAGYARFPRTTRSMFAHLNAVAAQSSADADHFLQLGMEAARVRVTGSIKFDVQLESAMQIEADALIATWGLSERSTFIVASTHEGEDQLALDAFARLREAHPGALLLLAPRHPERFAAVARLCESAGWQLARRSRDDAVSAGTDILLIDTLGELLLLFGVAEIAVIGGSFVPRGGHNPLEAAAWARPLLCGPSMFNFADITHKLRSAGALEQVEDAAALAARLDQLFTENEARQRMGVAAEGVVAANRGARDAQLDIARRLLGAA